jgi:radical SAM protein (TIGR04043 family)/putative N-acetyltransferase (TIGR04045 family)
VQDKQIDTVLTAELITELQCNGVRVPAGVNGRRAGAGPAEGRAMVIGPHVVNVPIAAPYVRRSPFALNLTPQGWMLSGDGRHIGAVQIVAEPAFYRNRFDDGTPYRHVALLHGRDCLATTVLQRCAHWRAGRRCAFCGTEVSLDLKTTVARKTPAQLAEVAAAAKVEGAAHVVLTSGCGDPAGSEISHLAKCATAVKVAADLPVQVQIAPPPTPDGLKMLLDAGVDCLGIHVETLHGPTLASVAPAKAAIGIDRYLKAWQRAVTLFGPGQVSSFLIVGLGEPAQSVIDSADVLADLGVYPFVVPLRPLPGSAMAQAQPPPAPLLGAICQGTAQILKRKGLRAADARAGCVRCGACSPMQAFETAPSDMVVHPVRSAQQQKAAFALRRAVFVEEQGLFTESDLDDNDAISTILVAVRAGQVIGTVRLYPANGNGHWIGGRLAVDKGHRAFKAGAALVEEAVAQARRRGATRFTASIQQQNVPFFIRLGWKPIGSTIMVMDRPHQQMEADLSLQRLVETKPK